ncbi:hypothetical protein [Bacillus sp. OV166]|uniref:hypothetical protein n=1 Tax=Bacillus sp. OV166 TaxID=1882763 RepID=UPI000B43EA7C|nr:hypothetical protein [Bacillus sp. OV166]
MKTLHSSLTYAPFITAIMTFSAALLAHVVSHRYTAKREHQKYIKECYQNLYSPMLFKVIRFMDVKTTFYKPLLKDNLDENKIIDDALKIFRENLRYATPNLITKFEV